MALGCSRSMILAVVLDIDVRQRSSELVSIPCLSWPMRLNDEPNCSG